MVVLTSRQSGRDEGRVEGLDRQGICGDLFNEEELIICESPLEVGLNVRVGEKAYDLAIPDQRPLKIP